MSLRWINFFLLLFFWGASALAEPSYELPFRRDAGLTKAEYLISVENYAAAIETANDVLARHPTDADAFTYRGYAYLKLEQGEKAAADFKRALAADPAHLGANKYLAETYLAAGDAARALEQLQVIRAVCGLADCEELRVLEREIDTFKKKEK